MQSLPKILNGQGTVSWYLVSAINSSFSHASEWVIHQEGFVLENMACDCGHSFEYMAFVSYVINLFELSISRTILFIH